MDKIFVKNLVLASKIGVTQKERSKNQNVILDIEVFCDLTQAGVTDDLSKSVSYSEIQEKVTELVEKGEFKLLESLAENVALLILESPIASRVSVAVKKEKYNKKPMMGIELTRDRHG